MGCCLNKVGILRMYLANAQGKNDNNNQTEKDMYNNNAHPWTPWDLPLLPAAIQRNITWTKVHKMLSTLEVRSLLLSIALTSLIVWPHAIGLQDGFCSVFAHGRATTTFKGRIGCPPCTSNLHWTLATDRA
eukprot:1941251-Ditylum_brightwellii.AAC.1